MENHIISAYIFLFLIVTGMVKSGLADDFEKVGIQQEVTLYERWIPGEQGEKVRELKAEFTINSNISRILEVLKDANKSEQWNVNAAEVKIRALDDPEQWLVYTRYDIPWPLNDQDCWVIYRQNGDPQHTVVSFSSMEGKAYGENEGIDRITGIQGSWILESVGTKKIKVTYRITSDRSDKVPRWVSDKVIHNNLYRTMATFKHLSET